LESIQNLQYKLKEITHAKDEFENRCRDLERIKLENDRLT